MIPLLRPTIARHVVPRAGAVQTRGILNSVLYGSEQAKKEGELEIQQYSRLIGRGKYVHGFETHRVHPDKVEEYKKAAQEHYEALLADPDLHVKLTGSWETTVGPLDTFVHILEYENYGGYDRTTKAAKNSARVRELINNTIHTIPTSCGSVFFVAPDDILASIYPW
ncbi:NIPSNAP protein [Ceratobasidium sp. AG-Ba]|nr:NIPSNAP protein [Ceratobasidium sp. AG-Ba]